MSIEEELNESAEKARAPFEKRVAATMAILAAILAIVSVMGHLAATEEVLAQQKASDQWAYYQAKSIRRYESEIARDLLAQAGGAKTQDYDKNVGKYTREGDEIEKQARELENESHMKGREALRLDYGEVFLEIAIVLASLAILTKLPVMWWASIASGALGASIAATMAIVK